MTVTYLKDLDLIKIEAPEIVAFVTNIQTYSSITLTSNRCGANNISIIYNTTEILNINSKYFIVENILYVRPSFFNLAIFVDDVYKLTLRFTLGTSGYTLIENCIFIDITYKCKVAAYLKNILEENTNLADEEKVSTIIHILHYSLINGSNCGCNCTQLCEVFTELKKLLDNTKPENINCGC